MPEMCFLTRACLRCLTSFLSIFVIMFYAPLLLALTGSLAFLVLYVLALIADTVAVVGFGHADGAKIRRDLSDKHLIDTRYGDLGGRGTFERDARGLIEFNGMREPDVENELIALFCDLPADALYFERLYGAFRYADDHAVNERAVKTVARVGFLFVVQRDHGKHAAFVFHVDRAFYLARERAFAPFYGDDAVFELNGDACGNRYRFFTDS